MIFRQPLEAKTGVKVMFQFFLFKKSCYLIYKMQRIWMKSLQGTQNINHGIFQEFQLPIYLMLCLVFVCRRS